MTGPTAITSAAGQSSLGSGGAVVVDGASVTLSMAP